MNTNPNDQPIPIDSIDPAMRAHIHRLDALEHMAEFLAVTAEVELTRTPQPPLSPAAQSVVDSLSKYFK